MASENLQRNHSRRREEERLSGTQEMGNLRARDDATTPPEVETPEYDAGFQRTDNPPRPPRPNATRSREAGKRTSSAPPMFCVVSAYCYSPLPDRCIRMLRLMPHRDEKAPIQCQLFDYPLLDSWKGTHRYEALSYAWGCSDRLRHSISVGGCG